MFFNMCVSTFRENGENAYTDGMKMTFCYWWVEGCSIRGSFFLYFPVKKEMTANNRKQKNAKESCKWDCFRAFSNNLYNHMEKATHALSSTAYA